jgi:acetylcholinesterase
VSLFPPSLLLEILLKYHMALIRFGQSAGAISASLQMLAYGGTTENLFHAAFMSSGAPIPVGNITGGQKYYDFLVQETGCDTSTQTLACLRQLPIETLKAAVDKSPNFLSYQVGMYLLGWPFILI